MAEYAKKYKKNATQINAAALNKLKLYSWPGNIRELQHILERAVIMSENHVLRVDDFLFPDTIIKVACFEPII